VEEANKELSLKPFNFEEYHQKNQELVLGIRFVNVSATALLFEAFCKILRSVLSHQKTILARVRIHKRHIKLFVIDYSKLDMAEYILYSAIDADPYSVFYLPPYSDDAQLLKEIIQELPI